MKYCGISFDRRLPQASISKSLSFWHTHKRFAGWFNEPQADVDGLLRAGVAHAWFEFIHPFEDDNRCRNSLADEEVSRGDA